MINLETIEREISELETRRDTTYSTCERLAWLYVVRDHLLPVAAPSEEAVRSSGSDFLDACDGVPVSALMGVINEHVEAVRILYPKEYDSLLRRIHALKG